MVYRAFFLQAPYAMIPRYQGFGWRGDCRGGFKTRPCIFR